MEMLLASDERPAVEVREGHGPFVVVCEHASNRLPRALGMLGLAPSDLARHIAFDPGAAALADAIARRTASTLVAQRYSRLAIDCNREPSLADAVPTKSEDTIIPGNLDLAPAERASRIAALWRPFHTALEHLLDWRRDRRSMTALVTIHSFTPVYRGVSRPWHAGIVSTDERGFSNAVLADLRRDKKIFVGDNQPYSARDNVDYTIRRHGRDRGLPHVMIEVRNDLLATERDIAGWADRLCDGLDRSAAAAGILPAEAGA